MGIKNRAFLLAISLSMAAPVFADSTASKALSAVMGDRSMDSKQGTPSKNPLQNAWAFHNFGLEAGGSRIDLGAAGSSRGFSDISKGTALGGSSNAGTLSNDHPVSVFDVETGHGNSSGSQGDKDKDKNHGHGNDGAVIVSLVPEPGSGTLSLIGFALLGLSMYRRKGPTDAI